MTLLAALWWLAALRVTAQLQAPKLNPTDVLRGIVSRLLNWPPVAPLVDASTVQIRAPGAAILRIQRKPDPLEVQGRSADGRSRPHWRRPGLPAKRGNHVRLGGGPLHGWVWRRAVGLALFVVHSVVLAAEPGLAAAREAFDRKTYEAAYSVYLPFAERGYLEAQQHVGHMLELGWGVAPDRAAAARWYALAAAHGEERARADPAALASFAWLLQAGKGLPQDRTKAVGLYAEAAQGGSVVAMYWLGMCHEQGWGTAKNADMAVSWFRRAAALGYVTAQLRLAAYYDKTAGGAPRGGPSRAPEHNAVMAMALRFAKQQRWRATDFGCLAVPPAGAVPRAKPDVPSLDAIGNDGTVLREVADLLSCEGRHGEAEPYFRRSLALREDGWTARRIGTADLMAATLYAKALNNLSVNLIEQRKRDEALPLLLRAVEVLEQARPHANDRGEFGVVSADFGSSFYTIRKNLATLHAKRSEFAEADALFRNLLSEYPTARYESAVLAREWGASLNAAGRHVEAEALFRRALEVFQRLDEPVSATKTEQYLADSLMRQGKAEQARPLFERAAAMWEQREGPDAMSTNKALQELAAAESESGAGAEALEHYRRACDFFRRTSDASARENPTATRAGSRDDLADCEAGKARALFRSAIPVKQAALVEGARAEAFIAAQLAMQSAAGDAMAHSAAKIAASRMGDGALAEAYEQAQQRARTVASALSESYSQPDREASPRRLQLRALLDQAERDRQRVPPVPI